MQWSHLTRRVGAPRALGVAIVCAAFAALPGTAVAGNVDASLGGSPEFTASLGEANAVSVVASNAAVSFTDTNQAISVTDGSNCVGGGTITVTCYATDSEGITDWRVFGDDGNDVLVASGPLSGTLSGGDGNDTVIGSNDNQPVATADGSSIISGVESLSGGSGTDSVQGRGGDDAGTGGSESFTGAGDDNGDLVDLGPGDDAALFELSQGQGDTYQGGPGVDSVGTVSTDVLPSGPFDSFSANLTSGGFARAGAVAQNAVFGGFEDYAGGERGNVVVGSIGSNVISGGDGADNVAPSAGSDQVSLRGGNDSADTRDGFADRVQCGPGVDSVLADQLDELVDCESVSVTRARPAGADVVAPKCSITKVKGTYSRKSFTKGLSVRLTCSEAATVTAQEYVTFKSSRSLATASAVGDLVLAEKTVKPGALAQTIKLKPSAKVAKRLPKKFTAKVRITAQDEFGNRSVVSKKTKVGATKAKKKSKSKKRKSKKKKSKKK